MPRPRDELVPGRRRAAIIAALTLVVALAAPHVGAASFDGRSWWDTVRVLADDRFEGRETGSAGERAAQRYVIGRLRALGVAPAGIDGFNQPVELRSRRIVEANSSVALVSETNTRPLAIGDDLLLSARVALAPSIEAPLVFVGYGLVMPELGHDDLAGLDLTGKIAVFLGGSPASAPSALAAHYQATGVRWQALKRAGAIGYVRILNPASMERPWERIALSRSMPSMYLKDPEFDETAGARFAADINPAHADLLFAGTGHTFEELAALGKDRAPLPRFVLPLRLRATTALTESDVHSNNLAAVVRGADPTLRSTYVVLSAHLDHLGIGEPINGDRIYHGAMDNASGSALLLDLARNLMRAPHKPRRSVLLLWVTGEEKGLLGSRYFATHPTVPPGSIVADLNVDMFLPIIPLKRVTVFGLEESDLGDRVTRVAQSLGIDVQPDPEPLRDIFIRSDQYNFVRRGVPALMIDVGAEPGSAEAEALTHWVNEHYHAPSDDGKQPIDLAAAGRFEELMLALTRQVADDPVRPEWKPNSPFRRFAGGGGAAH